MGEVYRARDTRLDRVVAIKVLPSHLADAPDLQERFEREARAVAALNHPHICTLHDVGRQDDTAFLVMEHLEGETLAARLEKGALPVDQALRYAIQIADALDKAHSAGIVHRDLKPANIMLVRTGAKLLDFGLAKSTASVAPAGLSMLPTTPPGLTAQGAILGTFQYMAPEQLEGQDADLRTDVFAFGLVVYEMVTGRRAFEGKSQASLIAAIMHVQPPAPSTIAPLTPSALDLIVTKCLEKDPHERWQSAKDLRDTLEWCGSERLTAAGIAQPVRSRTRALIVAWTTAAVALTVALLLAGMRVYESRPPAPEPVRFSVAATARHDLSDAHGRDASEPDGPSGLPGWQTRGCFSHVAVPNPRRSGSDRLPRWTPDSWLAPKAPPRLSGRPTASRSASSPPAG